MGIASLAHSPKPINVSNDNLNQVEKARKELLVSIVGYELLCAFVSFLMVCYLRTLPEEIDNIGDLVFLALFLYSALLYLAYLYAKYTTKEVTGICYFVFYLNLVVQSVAIGQIKTPPYTAIVLVLINIPSRIIWLFNSVELIFKNAFCVLLVIVFNIIIHYFVNETHDTNVPSLVYLDIFLKNLIFFSLNHGLYSKFISAIKNLNRINSQLKYHHTFHENFSVLHPEVIEDIVIAEEKYKYKYKNSNKRDARER